MALHEQSVGASVGRSPAQGTCLLAAGSWANGALEKAAKAGLGKIMCPQHR